MFKNILFAFLFFQLSITPKDVMKFEDYFHDKTLRIDYLHIGSNNEEIITIDRFYTYDKWNRNKKNLVDNFNNGRYYFKIYDLESGTLIYSKGFDSYFGEYKTGDDGLNGIKKAYHESAIIPHPKNKFRFVVENRLRDNSMKEIYSAKIDPDDMNIVRETTNDPSVLVVKSLFSGNPENKVDVVILGDGYTSSEQAKFKSDLEKFTNTFFKLEPYARHKNKFNVYGVLKPSVDSGTDLPMHNIFKNTVLNTTFNSLGSERYLLTEDNKTMRDLAAYVPYDAIYIMVNHDRYGGGGIYNLFCTFTSDNQFQDYLFLHEFGHSFAGLADEYYTSDVAYNEFYPDGVEPVEPNITRLMDPENIKWKNLTAENIELPTPWEKVNFDKMDLEWQAERRAINNKIAELTRNRADEKVIAELRTEYDKKDREHSEVVDKYLKSSKFYGKVGAYEGAGYASKGLYRSMLDCIMFSKGTKPFCKVCEAAIEKVINFYAEE
ncbi:MAG: peptidase M64 [Ignavibacteriales bacterium]|nr:MAG: peptidase M64 [Ignavibacteriales bacterium]